MPTVFRLGTCLLLLCAAAFTPANAQTLSASLSTRQTVLRLVAGETAPYLAGLGTPGQELRANQPAHSLISTASYAGRSIPLEWKINSRASHSDPKSVSFVYDCADPKLRLSWEWKVRDSTGPLEHSIRIANLDSRELWIPLQDSFSWSYAVSSNTALRHFFVEKGAGKPSDVGTHDVSLQPGYQWTGKSSTYAHPAPAEPREIIPFLAVQETDAPHDGWYAGVEFSGRIRLSVSRDSHSVQSVAGLDPDPGSFRTRLSPGQSFETPTVFVGAFSDGTDALGNVLRPWVRQVLGHREAWADPKYPLLVNNTWGSGMEVNEALVRRMIRDSAELGLEMLHIDAGWFRGVGDWYPDPKKFPQGLAALADEAHRNLLRFGIWVDWTQAGLNTYPGALNVRDPKVRDWIVSDVSPGWKPEPFKGQTIDIGVPAAKAYAQNEVFRMVDSYHLDMLEHDGYLVAQGCVRDDHPHAPPNPSNLSIVQESGASFVNSSNSTDVSYHAARAYYNIYENLRSRHPNLLLEICNDGGRMVDFGTAAHGDYFSITDTYDPPSNRRAFYDASHLLPAAMLESYVEKWPTPRIENFRYMLRSGMMGWLTIMLDTNAWSQEQHTIAKDEFQLYKTELRPLIRDANLFHISPRPDGIHWDAVEYFDGVRRKGVVYVFHGSDGAETAQKFKLAGLSTNSQYELHFHDHSSPDLKLTGTELLNAGLAVHLPVPNSSELVFIEESGRAAR